MARYTVSGRSTITPTAALPGVSLYATTGVRPRVREVHIWNTGAALAVFALNRLTTAGTVGAGLTEIPETDPAQTAVATGFAGHSAGPTVGGEIRRADLAASGGGVIWTFGGDAGLLINNTTSDGVGILTPTGTGQVFDYTIVWDE